MSKRDLDLADRKLVRLKGNKARYQNAESGFIYGWSPVFRNDDGEPLDVVTVDQWYDKIWELLRNASKVFADRMRGGDIEITHLPAVNDNPFDPDHATLIAPDGTQTKVTLSFADFDSPPRTRTGWWSPPNEVPEDDDDVEGMEEEDLYPRTINTADHMAERDENGHFVSKPANQVVELEVGNTPQDLQRRLDMMHGKDTYQVVVNAEPKPNAQEAFMKCTRPQLIDKIKQHEIEVKGLGKINKLDLIDILIENKVYE